MVFFSSGVDASVLSQNSSSSSCSAMPPPTPTNLNQLFDELIQDIISRLPAKYVLRCSTVCKRWKALTTSAPYFAELHQKHSFSPMILVEKETRPDRHHRASDTCQLKKKLYSFDAWETTREQVACDRLSSIRKRLKHMSQLSEHRHADADADDEGDDDKLTLFMAFSSCGLVVFHHQNRKNGDDGFSPYCVILNPITGEKVTIKSNNTSIRGQVYGLFYHPVLKEFCILWGQVPMLRGFYWRFLELKLLNLGPSQPCWRNIKNISCFKTHMPRFNENRGVDPPIVLDNVLYWMVNLEFHEDKYSLSRFLHDDDDDDSGDLCWPISCQEAILAYDIIKEEFELLPHPGPRCKNDKAFARTNHGWMGLLETNNNGSRDLSICQRFNGESLSGLINIWIYKKQEIYININGGGKVEKGLWIKQHTVKNFPGLIGKFRPFSLIDGQYLLVFWKGVGGGIALHILEKGTCEVYLGTKALGHNEIAKFMCSHSHSFVSMGKSKSEILMENSPEIQTLLLKP